MNRTGNLVIMENGEMVGKVSNVYDMVFFSGKLSVPCNTLKELVVAY